MMKLVLSALLSLSAQAAILELEVEVKGRPVSVITGENWSTFEATNRLCFTFGLGGPQPIPRVKDVKATVQRLSGNRALISLPLDLGGVCGYKLSYAVIRGTDNGNLLSVEISNDVRIPEILGDAGRNLRAEYVGKDASLFVDDVTVQENVWGVDFRVSAAQAKARGKVRRKMVMEFKNE